MGTTITQVKRKAGARFGATPSFHLANWRGFRCAPDAGNGAWLDNLPPGGNRHLNGSDEQEWYLSPSSGDASPFGVNDNGHLVITASPIANLPYPYGSGAISSYGLFSQRFGRFRARMQVPSGPGWRPAFWLLPDDLIYHWEFDVCEVWQGDTSCAHQTIIGPVAGDWQVGQTCWPTVQPPDTAAAMHTYGLDWTPTAMVFSVDNVVTGTFTPPDGAGDPAGPGAYLIFNLAVGAPGSWCGAPTPNADGTLPSAEMIVGEVIVRPYVSG